MRSIGKSVLSAMAMTWASMGGGLATAQEPAPAASDAPVAPEPAPAVQPPPADTTAPEKPANKRAASEEMTITGSRIRRKDLTTPAPVTLLTREQFEESGKATVGDFLQTMPEQGNAPNFQLNNGGISYGADGATRISLRSLGITRTLVLVNGRRVVPSGFGASPAVDINSIPNAAVERIEVLKDGASAVYGSDAIAGVVNIITRKRYNGTEASVQYGLSGHGDAQTFDAHVTTGRSGDAGNFLFSVGYFNQGPSWLRDRPWSANALTWDYTLNKAIANGSHRTPQGDIALPSDANGQPLPGCLANPVCRALVQSDPTWTNDTFIHDPSTPLGWRVAKDADLYNFASENYLTIPSHSVQAYSSGDTHFGSSIRGYYETSYVQRFAQENAAPFPLNPGDYTIGGGSTPISVSKDSLYNPFGVDLPFAGRRLVEFGHRTYTQDLGTFRVVTGLDGTLPESAGVLRGWFWDASMNYGRTTGTFSTAGSIRNSRIADAVGPSMVDSSGIPRCVRTPGDITSAIPGCVPLNLFGGPNNGSIDPSQISGLGFDGTSRAVDGLFSIGLNTSGDLFDLMSNRPVSLALGYEYRLQSGAQIADPIASSGDSADFNFKSTEGRYTAHEAYGELALPIIADLPGLKDLEATVAGRYVNYSTFGGNFTYKFGARYTPVEDITLRGTYSTAFRAPTISELYLGQSETGPNATDPCNFDSHTADPALIAQCRATGVGAGGSGDTGRQELTHVGGNGVLKPETARVVTGGVVIQPRVIRNLSVTVDYYNITVNNIVGTLGTPAILAGCYPGSSGTSYQPYCDLITRASNGRIQYVTDINQNVGTTRTAGVDLAARYILPTAAGRFGFSFDGNWLAFYDRAQLLGPTPIVIHGRGNYDLGGLPALKMNLGVNWTKSGLNAGVIGRYVGTLKECGAFDSSSGDYLSNGGLCYATPGAPSRDVGAYVVFDLHVGYTLSSPVGKTTFTVGMNNVLDAAPPYIYSTALANSDPSLYDYVGRYIYGRVAQSF